MSEQAAQPPPAMGANPPAAAPSAADAAARVTRENSRRATEEANAADDSESRKKGKEKEKEVFKGKVEKMGGNVFQLAEEARKSNQFSQTMDALRDYVRIELDHALDLAPLFATPCQQPDIPEPDEQPPMSADGVNRVTRDNRGYIRWKAECDSYFVRIDALAANSLKLYTVIILQCSQSVKMKLEATAGYEPAKATCDCTWLLTTLKNVCHRFDHSESRFQALWNAKAAIFNCHQGPQQSVTDYYETFRELVSVLESYGGKLHDPEEAAPTDADLAALANDAARDAYMRHRYQAHGIPKNADKHSLGHL